MQRKPYIKNKLVCGVGINDLVGSVRVEGKLIKSYKHWTNVLERCYSSKFHQKQPTYFNCTVCEEWKYFSNFKQWFDENYIEGFDLDKDILVEGNKIYSPEFCIFVPHYLNMLTSHQTSTREMPIGVYELKGENKYRASCNNGYGKNICKTCKTIEEAQAWYSSTKKRIVKEQAIRAFLDNAIKTDVYLALVRREF